MEASGESVLRGPDTALYCGATGGFSRVSGNGMLVLTNRRLLFQKVTGGRIEVALEQMAGLRENKWFLRSYRSGRVHLILQLRSGDELGFLVAHEARWRDALDATVGMRGERDFD